MRNSDINNHFGDMDLFLLDSILKGHIPTSGNVLDLGCGEGRNGIYFIKEGYGYTGVDTDESKIRLVEYLAKSFSSGNVHFEISTIQDVSFDLKFDLAILSRVLHFAKDENDFAKMWVNMCDQMVSSGVVYGSMDSAIENTLATPMANGLYEFPDGKIRFCLTVQVYDQIKEGFEEIEPLRTVVHHGERAQSFFLLRKR